MDYSVYFQVSGGGVGQGASRKYRSLNHKRKLGKLWLLMQYLYVNGPLIVTDYSLNPRPQNAEQSANKTSLIGIAKLN